MSGLSEAELNGPGWFWTRTEWAEWSNELSELIDDGDESTYSNPDGAQESVILDCFRAYKAERDDALARLAEVRALADQWGIEAGTDRDIESRVIRSVVHYLRAVLDAPARDESEGS